MEDENKKEVVEEFSVSGEEVLANRCHRRTCDKVHDCSCKEKLSLRSLYYKYEQRCGIDITL